MSGQVTTWNNLSRGDIDAADLIPIIDQSEAGTNKNKTVRFDNLRVTDFEVAHIRTDGDDVKGDGTPQKPLFSLQKAIDLGFTCFDLGNGNFGPGVFPGAGAVTCSFRGRGHALTGIPYLYNPGQNLTVHDTGIRSVRFNQISTGQNTAPAPAGNVTVEDVNCSQLDANGANATGVGVAGGNAGSVTVLGISSVDTVAANGGWGSAGDGTTQSGDGANGGAITIQGPTVVIGTISAVAGQPGSNLGGGAGAAGADGSATLRQGCDVPTPSLGINSPTVVGAIINGVFTAS